MREFLELAIVMALVVTVTALLIAGVVRHAVKGLPRKGLEDPAGRARTPAEDHTPRRTVRGGATRVLSGSRA